MGGMHSRIQFPGKYIQGFKVVEQLPAFIAELGTRGLVLASPSAGKILAGKPALAALPVITFKGECSEAEVARVIDAIRANKADVLVGMGGGKAIDTAKIAADRCGIAVIILPTIASTDAPCSGCAVLYSDHGVFERVYYQKANPALVLVDTDIIARAPARFLVAGMGDALSTWFEAKSCTTSQSKNECNGLGTMTGLALARLCYDTLLKSGPAALDAARAQAVTPAFEHIVEANILLSGVGFESGGLASAHSIHNGLTALPETHAFYHGEKVAIGTLAGLILTDADPAQFEEAYAFCKSIGLPVKLADIGITDTSREHLMIVAEKACAPGEYIHHECGLVTPEKVLNALLALNSHA
jgi:glycerol dehydrogenase